MLPDPGWNPSGPISQYSTVTLSPDVLAVFGSEIDVLPHRMLLRTDTGANRLQMAPPAALVLFSKKEQFSTETTPFE
jgi:hypothetical protein